MIYCVEDDPGIRELIVYTLEHSGFEAKGFERGEELFQALKVCCWTLCCPARTA